MKNRAVHRIRESEYLPLTSDRAAVRPKKTFNGPAAGKPQRKRHKKETKIDNNGEIERLSRHISSEQTENKYETTLRLQANQEQR